MSAASAFLAALHLDDDLQHPLHHAQHLKDELGDVGEDVGVVNPRHHVQLLLVGEAVFPHHLKGELVGPLLHGDVQPGDDEAGHQQQAAEGHGDIGDDGDILHDQQVDDHADEYDRDEQRPG